MDVIEYSLFCISSRRKKIFEELPVIQVPGTMLTRFEVSLAAKMSENPRIH